MPVHECGAHARALAGLAAFTRRQRQTDGEKTLNINYTEHHDKTHYSELEMVIHRLDYA